MKRYQRDGQSGSGSVERDPRSGDVYGSVVALDDLVFVFELVRGAVVGLELSFSLAVVHGAGVLVVVAAAGGGELPSVGADVRAPYVPSVGGPFGVRSLGLLAFVERGSGAALGVDFGVGAGGVCGAGAFVCGARSRAGVE